MTDEDTTVVGFLNAIKKGDVDVVGVMADYLEEIKHKKAKRVRQFWNKLQRMLSIQHTIDFTRLKNTQWESEAKWRRWLWWRIRTLFNLKMKWHKSPPLGKFVVRNTEVKPT